MIRGIHHTAISTPDIDRAIAFYRDLLGFEVLVDGAWPPGVESVDTLIGLKNSAARMAMLKKGNAMLELFEFESPAPAPGSPHRPVNDHGLTHICLDVTDLGSEYARLKDAGMFFHSAPVGTGNSLWRLRTGSRRKCDRAHGIRQSGPPDGAVARRA